MDCKIKIINIYTMLVTNLKSHLFRGECKFVFILSIHPILSSHNKYLRQHTDKVMSHAMYCMNASGTIIKILPGNKRFCRKKIIGLP